MSAPSLLPSNAGLFERVSDDASATWHGPQIQRTDLVRTLWNPWTCAPDQLPLLAWAWSVDIWNEAWPLARKRKVVAEARVFHERKTTVAGFRMALGYVEAELVRAHLPRHGFVVAPAPTPEAHAAWLQRLPEIRIYPREPKFVDRNPGFYVGRRPVDGAEQIVLERRRAELRKDGKVTPLAFMQVRYDSQGRLLSEAERLIIPVPPRRMLKACGPLNAPVGGGLPLGDRIITLGFSPSGDPYLPNAVPATLKPVNVTPIKVFAARQDRRGLAAGRRPAPVRAANQDIEIYFSIRLADGSTAAIRNRISRSAVNRARIQPAPFEAHLLVHAPVPYHVGFPKSGWVVRPVPEARKREVHAAVAVAQGARDTVFVDLNSTRPLTFGDLARMPPDVRAGTALRT